MQRLVNIPDVAAIRENFTQATVVGPELKCHSGFSLSFSKDGTCCLGDTTESKFTNTDFSSQVQE